MTQPFIPSSFAAKAGARLDVVEAALAGKSAVGHTHAWADITGKPTIPVITQGAHLAAPTGTATTNLPTNYNTLSGLLGLSDGLNSANAAQNAMGGIVNDHKSKITSIISTLEANGMRAAA